MKSIARHRVSLIILLIGSGFSLWVSAVTGQPDTGAKIPFRLPPTQTTDRASSAASASRWQRLETDFTMLHYETDKDLRRFDKSIAYARSGISLPGFLSLNREGDLLQEVSRKVDTLFLRVQEILDMRNRVPKVTVRIFPDKERLYDECTRVNGGDCRIRAWYIFENNTVYVNADDIHEGILAHELAHSIIDHYFAIRPPRATAEILARYVDRHLHF